MAIKIEKNIPVPLKSKHGGNNKANQMRAVIIKMKVGDSVVVTNPEYFDYYNAKKYSPEMKKMKFTSRRIDENTKRLWRIK